MRLLVSRVLTGEILTKDQAGKLIGVHGKTIWQWIADGTLPALQIGRSWIVDRRDAEAIAARYRNCGPSGKKCRRVGESGGYLTGTSPSVDTLVTNQGNDIP